MRRNPNHDYEKFVEVYYACDTYAEIAEKMGVEVKDVYAMRQYVEKKTGVSLPHKNPQHQHLNSKQKWERIKNAQMKHQED